jgi:hypothetical protein
MTTSVPPRQQEESAVWAESLPWSVLGDPLPGPELGVADVAPARVFRPQAPEPARVRLWDRVVASRLLMPPRSVLVGVCAGLLLLTIVIATHPRTPASASTCTTGTHQVSSDTP